MVEVLAWNDPGNNTNNEFHDCEDSKSDYLAGYFHRTLPELISIHIIQLSPAEMMK